MKEEDINKATLEEFRLKPRATAINYPISVKDAIVDTDNLPFYIKGEYIDHSTATFPPSPLQGHATTSSRKPVKKRNVSRIRAYSDQINRNENEEVSDPDDLLPLSELRYKWEYHKQ